MTTANAPHQLDLLRAVDLRAAEARVHAALQDAPFRVRVVFANGAQEHYPFLTKEEAGAYAARPLPLLATQCFVEERVHHVPQERWQQVGQRLTRHEAVRWVRS